MIKKTLFWLASLTSIFKRKKTAERGGQAAESTPMTHVIAPVPLTIEQSGNKPAHGTLFDITSAIDAECAELYGRSRHVK